MLQVLLLCVALGTPSQSDCANPVMAGLNGASLPTIVGTNSRPDYPEEARVLELGGLVRMRAVICADGKVNDVQVVDGIPWARMLDEAAARAVRSWTYRPALQDGKPVPVFMTVGVNFDTAPGKPTPWAKAIVKLKLQNSTLEGAFAKLEGVGLKIEYSGSNPPVHRTYDETSVQAILHDLAVRYHLSMKLLQPNKLRITGLPGLDTEGIVPPVLESKTPLDLPSGVHGTVGVILVVQEDGSVETASVVNPSGSEDLDEAAVRAVQQWRYRPATSEDRPVAVYLPVTLEW